MAKPNIIICCKIKYCHRRFFKSMPVKPLTNSIIVLEWIRYYYCWYNVLVKLCIYLYSYQLLSLIRSSHS